MRRTALLTFSFVLIFLSAIGISAQDRPFATRTCPNFSVQPLNPAQVRAGQPVGFMANIAGGDPKVVPTIVWNTSAGTITQGQGSRRIVIDSTGAGDTPDRTVKAE